MSTSTNTDASVQPYVKNAAGAPVATPYLLMDHGAVERQYRLMAKAFQGLGIHYAVKCNPDVEILRRLHAAGCGFEIASSVELEVLTQLGVPAAGVLFSNPVKRPRDIALASRAGVWRFAFDSESELQKIAELAPRSAVYVRLSTNQSASTVASEGKFGISADEAVVLLRRAKELELVPYGLTFHVGSQMVDPYAWVEPIATCGEIARRLLVEGIRLSMIDIGGGFPVAYDEPVLPLSVFGDVIASALKKLPYEMEMVMEPGRSLVAEAGELVATVIGTARRNGRTWVHLDVGAFNGMMESLETQNTLRFPVSDSLRSAEVELCHLTGPSCDSQDTILFDVPMSRDLATGHTVTIRNAGAYTTSYASNFNGFPIPPTLAALANIEGTVGHADVLCLPE
jgi:ornithine decarboxylase